MFSSASEVACLRFFSQLRLVRFQGHFKSLTLCQFPYYPILHGIYSSSSLPLQNLARALPILCCSLHVAAAVDKVTQVVSWLVVKKYYLMETGKYISKVV